MRSSYEPIFLEPFVSRFEITPQFSALNEIDNK